MNGIALSLNGLTLYWSGVVIALGIAAAFCLSYALYTSHGGSSLAMLLYFPPALFLSVGLSRALHWYCHTEQYPGFVAALTDYRVGGYCIPGVVAGIALAAVLVGALGLTANRRRLLDSVAPGWLLLAVMIRLSSLFNSSCRSKIVIRNPLLQRLPIGSPVADNAGNTEYRFATFFAEALLLAVLFLAILRFFNTQRRHPMKADLPRDGHVALLTLTWYSAVELLMDSTRYDSSFLRFNGFISVGQMVAALCILGVMVVYSIRSVRVNGHQGRHWVLWICWFLALAATGISEYLVQRHGSWYLGCYAVMSASCFFLAFTTQRMYLLLRDNTPRRRKRRPTQ